MDGFEISYFRLQSIALGVSGLLPPPICEKRRWKMVLYTMFTTLLLLAINAAVVFEFMSIFHNVDGIEKIIKALHETCNYVMVAILFIYFKWKGRTLKNLIHSGETRFNRHLKRVGTPEKQKDIFRESCSKVKMLTYPLALFTFFGLLMWGVLPSILRYVDYFILKRSESEMAEDTSRYFAVTWWTPEGVHKSPKFEMIQIVVFLASYFFATNLTSICLTMFIFQYHIRTMFKILCSAFEDLNTVINRKQASKNKFTDKYNPNTFTHVNMNEEETTLNEGCKKSSNGGEYSREVLGSPTHSGICFDEHDRLIQKYLIDCIEFHQEIIR